MGEKPDSDARISELRTAIGALLPAARAQLAELVSKRSVFQSAEFPAAENDEASDWVAQALREVGVPEVSVVATPDGSNTVFGHYRAPAGAPTVLLYSHFDVQPPGPETAWETPAFTLTERPGPDGAPRWYGRGAADSKGNIIAHLLALRAVGLAETGAPVGIRLVIEGSEEAGGAGLEELVRQRPDLVAADLVVIGDSGNVAVGRPTLTTSLRGIVNVKITVRTGERALHSGQFGGAAPDALGALIALLATLRDDAGNTTIDGLEADGIWPGVAYDEAAFRSDAQLSKTAEVIGSGSIADQIWSRPALTVTAIDAPATAVAANSIQMSTAAMLSLRVPPGMDPVVAQELLIAHLHRHLLWGAELTVEKDAVGQPFSADPDGPAVKTLAVALGDGFGEEGFGSAGFDLLGHPGVGSPAEVLASGQGGSIPLCNALAAVLPDAEFALIGVCDPVASIHAPNESVDPREIASMALAEALLISRLAQA